MSDALAVILVNAAWQLPVLATLAFAATRWGSLSATERHRLWGIALLLCLFTPLLTGLDSTTMSRATPSEPGAVSTTARPPELPPAGVTLTVPREAVSALGLLYVAFVALGALRLGRSFYRVAGLRRSASALSLPRELHAVEARCRRALGVEEGRLLVSPRVSGPVTCGLLDPVILVPPILVGKASRDLWTAVLGHELAHIQRRDYAWHVAFECLMLFVGIHPAARWIKKRLDRAREEACDELVARQLVTPRRYAGALVEAAGLFSRPTPEPTLGVLGAHSLEERIVALIDLETHRGILSRGLLAGIGGSALLLGGLALSSFSVALSAPSSQSGETREANAVAVAAESEDADDQVEPESYRAAGRRDPFVGPRSRTLEGPEVVWGFDVDTVSLHGIVKTPSGFTAMLVGPDEKTYFVREGQRFYNGTLARIGESGVTIRLQGADPPSALSRRDIELRLHDP